MAMGSEFGWAVLPVVTKVDKLKRSDRKPAFEQLATAIGVEPHQLLTWSAVTREGEAEQPEGSALKEGAEAPQGGSDSGGSHGGVRGGVWEGGSGPTVRNQDSSVRTKWLVSVQFAAP